MGRAVAAAFSASASASPSPASQGKPRGRPPKDKGPAAAAPPAAGAGLPPPPSARASQAAPPPRGLGPILVVVESPSKAKAIGKYLGDGYLVLASYGHVRDLLPKVRGREGRGGESAESAASAGGGAGLLVLRLSPLPLPATASERAGPGGEQPPRSHRHCTLLIPPSATRPHRQAGSVLPDAGFALSWSPLPRAAPHLAAIRAALPSARELVLASDPDREGEAIAWHLAEELARGPGGIPPGMPVRRAAFAEVTKKAVLGKRLAARRAREGWH